MSEEMHYVRGSRRQRGYYRRKPYTYDIPTKAQRKIRATLARTAYEKGRNKFGTVETLDEKGNVKEFQASAVPIMEEMRGLQVKPKLIKPFPLPIPPIERVRRLREILLLQAGTEQPVTE